MEEQKATKVTLYLPPDLHRQLKIRSAVEGEAMSSLAKRAIDFYLAHGDVVAESLESSFGQTHRIHNCPNCASPVVLREGELVEIASIGAAQGNGSLGDAIVPEVAANPGSREEGELVVC
ncbi:MAG: hypothetical protein DCF32_02335 [Leptolyngbya sp.]|nr:MAG: hypothetical protein DCF32_02335 [Leptolyngbya sp.]